MNKYKICIYAICKNEEKNIKEWFNSVKDADSIYVLDTGSTDNSVKILKELGVNVKVKNIKPWRFDVARNESLNLIPKNYQICVCTDLDEVFESGWKEKLINSWDDDITRVRYTYNWSFNKYGEVGTMYLHNKIHSRNNYKWVHPVHEVLVPINEEKEIVCKDIVLNHYPDRSKSRSNYLSLLELSVKEDPEDDRNMHYLGREYMYYGRWDDAITILKKHLKLKNATWKDERCASMRFIARCYKEENDIINAKEWYEKAVEEAPYLRESYVEIGYLYYEEKDYLKAYYYLKKGLEIDKKSDSYINEEFAWNGFIYDLLSICAFNLKLYKEALDNAKKVLEKDKDNIRLKVNLGLMERYVI